MSPVVGYQDTCYGVEFQTVDPSEPFTMMSVSASIENPNQSPIRIHAEDHGRKPVGESVSAEGWRLFKSERL
jgi:hypothetical protein